MNKKQMKERIKELEQMLEEKDKAAGEEYETLLTSLIRPGAKHPILIFKIGDKGKGWIPSISHVNALIKQVKKCKLDEQYNLLFFNYALELHTQFPVPELKEK